MARAETQFSQQAQSYVISVPGTPGLSLPISPHLCRNTIWRLHDLLGFINSWSGVQNFLAERGYHPVQEIEPALREAWGEPERERSARWPLFFRIGRLATES